MSEEYIKNISEKGIYPYAFQFAKSFAMYGAMQNVQKGKCYYCRGVNSILKEYNPMNIFVYANMESKINRCKQKADSEENLTDKELEKKIKTYVLWQIEKNMNMLKYNMEDDKQSL